MRCDLLSVMCGDGRGIVIAIVDFYIELIKCESIQFVISRLTHINQLNG